MHQYNYMVQPTIEMIVPQPGSKMAKYKTSLCKHYEQTGTCQMDSRCHFAHGKHELRKQTDALPSNVFRLYQTPINTVAPPGYVHNKYKTIPCKNWLEGAHCKYGDRCTFAHGDHDMRAKFVKAELLYSSEAQAQSADPSQIQTMPLASQYGTVDYTAFSQPPSFESSQIPVQMPSKVATEAVIDTRPQDNGDFGSDLQLPYYDGNTFQDEESDNFFNSFSYANRDFTSNGFNGAATTDSSGNFFSQPSGSRQVSKFGFCNETAGDHPTEENTLVDKMMGLKVTPDDLFERVDELELTSEKQEINEKFSQAKYQIDMGNIKEGNDILNDMIQNKEITFKKFADDDQNFMKTFDPISD